MKDIENHPRTGVARRLLTGAAIALMLLAVSLPARAGLTPDFTMPTTNAVEDATWTGSFSFGFGDYSTFDVTVVRGEHIVPQTNAAFSSAPTSLSVSLEPLAGASGRVIIEIEASGGTAGPTSLTVDVLFLPVPPPPVALTRNFGALEATATPGAPFIGTIAFTPSDPSVQFSATISDETVVPPANVTFAPVASNLVEVTLQPLTNQSGRVAFDIAGEDTFTTNAVSFEVDFKTYPPVIAPVGDVTIAEDTSTAVTVTVTDVDTASADVTVTATMLPPADGALFYNPSLFSGLYGAGALSVTGTETNRTLTIQPGLHMNGAATIRLTAEDDDNNVVTRDFQLVVTPVADPPEILDAVNVAFGDDSGPTNLFSAVTIIDVDHVMPAVETLRLTVDLANPVFARFQDGTTSFTIDGTPDDVTAALQTLAVAPQRYAAAPGNVNTVDATIHVLGLVDGLTAQETVTLSITVINTPPDFTMVIDPATLTQGGPSRQPFYLTSLADPDWHDDFFSLEISVADPAQAGLVLISPGGAMEDNKSGLAGRVRNVSVWAPDTGMTNDSVQVGLRVAVTDGHGGTTVHTNLMTVVQAQHPPVISGIPVQTVNKSDQNPDFILFPTVFVQDPDEGGQQPVRAVLSQSNPALGSFVNVDAILGPQTPASLTAALRAVAYELEEGVLPIDAQADTIITLTVYDRTNLSDQNSNLRIRVTSVNSPPIITFAPPFNEQPTLIPPTEPILPFTGVGLRNDDTNNVLFTIAIDDPGKGELTNLGGFSEGPSGVYQMSGQTNTILGSLTNIVYAVNPLHLFPPDEPGGTTFTLSARDFALLTTTRTLSIQIQDEPRNHLVTRLGHEGPGTFAYALASLGNNDVITFALPAYPAVIRLPGTQSTLINRNVTIKGPGADLLTLSGDGTGDGTPNRQLFRIGARVTIEGVTLSHGTAGFGGAVLVQSSGHLTLRHCAVVDSIAAQYGGAIDVNGGALTLDGCFIGRNRLHPDTGVSGAGISIYSNRDITIRNTTFAANQQPNAAGDGGAALVAENSTAGSPMRVRITHSTFAGNTDAAGRASAVLGVGIDTRIQPANSIFGDFSSRNLDVAAAAEFRSQGGNICDDSTKTLILQHGVSEEVYLLDHASDDVNTDPQLGPLVAAGHPTAFFPLLPGSPAINRSTASTLAVDQRGVLREGIPDRGAIEFGSAGRVVINEIRFDDAAGVNYVELYIPRDATPVELAPFSLYAGAVRVHDFAASRIIGDSPLFPFNSAADTLVRPGFGMVVALAGTNAPVSLTSAASPTPVVAASVTGDSMRLDARGAVTLRGTGADAAVAGHTYVGTYLDPANGTNVLTMTENSIALAPQFRGYALVPHGLILPGPFDGVDMQLDPSANPSSAGADVLGTPFGLDNALPLARSDTFTVGEDNRAILDVLANDFDSDGNDRLVIVDVSPTSAPGVGDASTTLSALGASVTVEPAADPLRGERIVYDPRQAPLLQQLPAGVEINDTFFYEIIDIGSSSIASFAADGGDTRIVSLNHRLADGDEIIITGAANAAYNGTHTVSVLDDDAFTIVQGFAGNDTPRGIWETVLPRSPSARSEAQVTVRVIGANDPPVAVLDVITNVTERSTVRLMARPERAGDAGLVFPADPVPAPTMLDQDVLSNDFDIDTDDTWQTLRIHGVLAAVNPIAGFSGTPGLQPVTVHAPAHGLAAADEIVIANYGGHATYNGRHAVTVLDADRFTIPVFYVDNAPDKGVWVILDEATRYAAVTDVGATVALTLRSDPTLDHIVYDANASAFLRTLSEGQLYTNRFWYAIEDSYGAIGIGPIDMVVEGVNDPPVVNPDPESLSVLAPLVDGTNTLAQVLAQGLDILYTLPPASGAPGRRNVQVLDLGGTLPGTLVMADFFTTDEDTPLDIDTQELLANDSDIDQLDMLTVVAVDPFSRELAALTLDAGVITYDPTVSSNLQALAREELVLDTFAVVVSDGMTGGSITSLVSVLVIGVNDTPIAHPLDFRVAYAADYTTHEDAVWSIELSTLLARGHAVEHDINQVAPADRVRFLPAQEVPNPGAAGVVISPTNIVHDATVSQLLDQLADWQSFTNVFDYAITDNSFLFAVDDRFHVPAGAEDRVLDVLANDRDFTDAEGLLTIVDVSPTLHGATVDIGPDGRHLIYSAPDSFVGEDYFRYTIRNDKGDTNSGRVMVRSVVPHLNGILHAADNHYTVALGETVLLDVTANDGTLPATGQDLTITGLIASDIPGQPVLTNNQFRFAATLPAPLTFTYEVSAGGEARARARVVVNVVDRRGTIRVQDDFLSVQPGSFDNVIDVLANDGLVTAPTTPLRIAEVVPPGATFGALEIDPTGKHLLYSPAADAIGVDRFQYVATDQVGGTGTGTVHIAVGALTPVLNYFTLEATNTAPIALDVLANNRVLPSPPPATLSISAVATPVSAIGTLAVDGGTSLVFQASGALGQQTFTYTIEDGGTPARTATGVVTIEAVGPGTYANPSVYAVRGNGEDYDLDVLVNDIAYPNIDKRYAIVSIGIGADGPSAGGTVIQSGNRLIYTPAPGYYGEERFKYTMSDSVSTDVAEVVIQVRRGTLAANADRYAIYYELDTDSGQPRAFTLPVLLNDGIQPAFGQTLSISAIGLGADGPDQGGTVAIAPGQQSLTYRPGAVPAPVYTERFAYEVSDGAGRFATAEVHVQVRNRDAVLAALTQDDHFSVALNSTNNILPVLANDFVRPGMAVGWQVTGVTTPTHGTAAVNGTSVLYAPPAGFVGVDVFTYSVNDGLGGTGSAAVRVRVGRLPLLPSHFTVLSDVIEAELDVLANDVLEPALADKYALDSVFGPTAGGTVALSPSNTVLYTPAPAYGGPYPYTETFQYRVPDDTVIMSTGTVHVTVHEAGSDRASSTVTLHVEGRNDPPVIQNTPPNPPITDKQTAAPFVDVTITEVDQQLLEPVDVTVSLDDADKGVLLNLGGFGNLGGGVYALTNVTAAVATDQIRQLVFEPTENRITVPTTEPTLFTIAVTDHKSPPVLDTNTMINVTAVNDPPVLSGTQAGQEYYYRLPILPFPEVTVSEVDDLGLQPLAVTVIILTPANGQFGNLGDFQLISNGVFRAQGLTAAEATAQLRALVFAVDTARVPFGGSLTTSFSIAVEDGFAPAVVDAGTSVIAHHPFESAVRPATVPRQGAFGLAVDTIDEFAVVGAPNASQGGDNTGLALVYRRSGGGTNTWSEWRELQPATVAAGHRFGRAVAISPERIVVGAVQAAATGYATLFERDLGGIDNWGEFLQIAPTNLTTGGLFGQAVALDGDLLAVGAPSEDINGDGVRTGGVFLFGRHEGGADAWGEILRWAPDGAGSATSDAGWNVALSGDRLVVGAPRYNVDGSAEREGAVFVLVRDGGGTWSLDQTLVAANTALSREYGWDVALDGDLLAVGAPAMPAGTTTGAGRVFLYESDGGTNGFVFVRQLDRRNDTERRFGHSLSLDGSQLMVGAPHNEGAQNLGAAYLYDRPDAGSVNWTVIEKFTRPTGHPAGLFGTDVSYRQGSAAIGAPADLVEASNRGYAFLYRFGYNTVPGLTYSLAIDPVFRSHGSGASAGHTLSVLANVAWTATNDVPWITVTAGASGAADGTLTYSVDANASTAGRSGTISVYGGGIARTFTVNQAGTSAALVISPSSRDHGAAGAAGQTVAVTANVDWSATNTVAWVMLTGGSAGSGDGVVTYSVAENPSTTARSGTITVSGGGITRTFTVNQAGADGVLLLTPSSRAHAAAGATDQAFDVAANVTWTATNTVAWLTVTGGTAGSGDGTVTYNVAGNPSTTARSGTITVSGGGLTRTFTVDQAGADPVLALTPSSRSHGSSSVAGQSIGVTANVAWTATKTAGWITITAGAAGSGNGTVSYSLSANSGAERSSTITVSGGGLTRTFTVNQAAATPSLTLAPASRDHAAAGAAGETIGVTANVSWTAVANQGWITVTGGAAGTGDGSVTYSVAVNASATARSGTVTVAGGGLTRTFTVNQAGAAPVLTLDPSSREHGDGAAAGQTVAVTANLSWTAVANQAWITVTGGAAGSGDGTVTYSVAANTATASRSGTITVANGGLTRTFTVNQSGTAMTPGGGDTIESRRPAFSWPAVTGATWYQLWINRNGQTHATPWVQGATTWTPPADLPAGSYTWWVRGWSPAGYEPWSPAAQFTLPLQQPGPITQLAPEGVQASRNLVFVWDQTDRRATWYKLWVSRPGGGVWHDQWHVATTNAVSSVAVNNHPGGNSTWWLRGWGPDGYGPWTGPMAFSTPVPPSPLPAKPTLITPADGAVIGGAVTFTYAAAQATWFRVYASRNGTVELDHWTQDESLVAGPFPAGSYGWWVGAWNAVTATTVWSDRRDFTVP